VHCWLLDKLSATRLGPWKAYSYTTEMDYDDSVTAGGFSGHTSTMTYGKTFNLFLDPKEEHSYTIRKLVHMPMLAAFAAQHLKTFDKYPKRIQVMGGDMV